MIRSLGFVVIGAVFVVALALAGGSAAQTVIQNPGFETGDTTGWDEVIPPGGSIEVVTECTGACVGIGSFQPYEPVNGEVFALLKTDGPDNFISLSQTLTAHAGTVISGWAFFYDGDSLDMVCDVAEVRVLIEDEPIPVFNAGTCIAGSTDWTQWTFTVPGSDCEDLEITIQARIANASDGVEDSRLGLDALTVDDACPTPTPEPPEEEEPTPVPTARPQLGGLIGPLMVAANSNRDRSSRNDDAAQQQEVAGLQAVDGAIGPISPPNTGDGGLLRPAQTDVAVYGAVMALTALGVSPWLLTRLRRTLTVD